LDIVQPDMFYLGGMIRSMKVARMAAAFDKPCVPHTGPGMGLKIDPGYISKHSAVKD
jgi:L-alanine-DL-glutamate epimerase-like enolase superfamily enzyme